jgi:hypothetical protein
MPSEVVRAAGHPNVSSTHKTTLEFTCESHLTERGDCIFAVCADKTMGELSDEFRESLRSDDVVLTLVIECNGVSDTVTARGHPDLILNHPTDFVVRKSSFICPRTLAVESDKAACDLKRELVVELQKGCGVVIKLDVQ